MRQFWKNSISAFIRSCCALFTCLAFSNVVAADNVALHARYTYTPAAEYEHTRSAADAVKLTDGAFAKGQFWTARDETVGWYQSGVISIEIDVGAAYLVDRVCVDSARGNRAGVSFPERVDLFVSLDQRTYAYVGDAMRGVDHEDGGYLVGQFCARGLSVPARYVLLMLQPRGNYTFLDEIEVFGVAAKAASVESARSYPFSRQDLKLLQANLFRSAMRSKAIGRMAASLLRAIGQTAQGDAELMTIYREIEALGDAQSGHGPAEGSGSFAKSMENLFALHRRLLAHRFKEELIIWHKDPWSAFTPLDTPDAELSSQTPVRFDLGQNGSASNAIVLTNNGRQVQQYRIGVKLERDPGGAPSLKVREVMPVLLANGTMRGDPLVELVDDTVTISPGESKQLWLSAFGQNASTGRFPGRIEFSRPGQAQPIAAVPIELHVWLVSTPQSQRLYVNTWSYLTSNAIRLIPEVAVADLFAHHVNVFVLDESQVPWPRFDPGSTRWTVDYAAFDTFIRLHKGAKKVLFYLEFNSAKLRTFGGRHAFMSMSWKALFRDWLDHWIRHATEVGLTREEFAFYPVDEPKDAAEAEYLIETAQLIKEIDPHLQVYTTVGSLGFIDLIRAARVVDIFQIAESELGSTKAVILKRLNKMIWSYSGSGKDADPLRTYRVQAWRAFQHDAKGIGFWAYADVGNSGTAWDDLDGTRPDPAVIYEAASGLASSKRWEAWREGVEDYELLYQAQMELQRRNRAANVNRAVDVALSGDYEQFEKVRRDLLSIIAGGAPALSY